MRRLAAVSATLFALACAAGDRSVLQRLEPVDHPPLDAVAGAAREQLTAARERLEAALAARRPEPRELAAAFGSLAELYDVYRLPEAAIACYENAARLDPASFTWPYELGLATAQRGDLEAAAAAYRRALALSPENAPARLRLAEVELTDGRLEEAAAGFRPVLEEEGYAAAAHYGLGRVELARGDAAEALTHFDAALALEPEAGVVHHSRGLALRQLGRLDEAREALARPANAEVAFPDPLAERLATLAESAGAFLQRGNRALVAGRLDEAVAAYRRAVEADPEAVEARRNLALALLRHGDAKAAVEALQAGLAHDPQRVWLHFDLGNAYLAAGEPELAVGAFQRAVELVGDFTDARFNLANTLVSLGRWQEAAEQLEAVLGEQPDNPRARYLAAMALHRTGHSQEAAERLAALVAERPTDATAREGLATVLADSHRIARARQVYEEALALDLPAGDRGRLLGRLAELAWRGGDRAAAIAYNVGRWRRSRARARRRPTSPTCCSSTAGSTRRRSTSRAPSGWTPATPPRGSPRRRSTSSAAATPRPGRGSRTPSSTTRTTPGSSTLWRASSPPARTGGSATAAAPSPWRAAPCRSRTASTTPRRWGWPWPSSVSSTRRSPGSRTWSTRRPGPATGRWPSGWRPTWHATGSGGRCGSPRGERQAVEAEDQDQLHRRRRRGRSRLTQGRPGIVRST